MEQTSDRRAVFQWEEEKTGPNNISTSTPKAFDVLLEPPKNTKYPSSAFYWAPSDKVGILYDGTTTIPGKPNHLRLLSHIETGWEDGPGEVTYMDKRGRGGTVQTYSCGIRHSKNWYIT